MTNQLHNYSSIADIQEFLEHDIAPKFFDFGDTNDYKIGVFGYINEVMSTITADIFNVINIAKREFYPATAQNMTSFYKMAGICNVDVPMTIPASLNAILMMREKEIIENSTIENGTYCFILDNTMTVMVDQMQFSIDYPIRIMAKFLNGSYSYTTYYDTSQLNSMHKSSTIYIQNKTTTIGNERFLLMQVELQQYMAKSDVQTISKNSELETVSLVFTYDGNLAGFDVFYTSDPGSASEIYIPAVSSNEITPSGAYCIYDFLADNKIRLTFPKNPYFSPKVNSEIRATVYTSSGSKGNFDEYLGEISCKPKSEKYPYNNSITIKGTANGKSSGGKDKKDDERFIREIKENFCTNGTITTSSDLQIYVNNAINDPSIRTEFTKVRDDVLQRLYSSFVLLKDDSNNVIPTNTCQLLIHRDEFDVFENSRGIIKPGKVFEYTTDYPNGIIISEHSLSENLDPYDIGTSQKFLFTNPFLICVSTEEGIVGYYGNSISEIKQTDFTFVENRSFYQFICLGIQVERNPIAGENFYTFTAKISPSSDIDPNELIDLDIDGKVKEVGTIRAKHDGRVISREYKETCVVTTIEYTDVPEGEEKTEIIQESTYSVVNPDGTFKYNYGYEMQFHVLDEFVEGDIIAIPKVIDRGRLRAAIDFNSTLLSNMLYIPMYIEGYDTEKKVFILKGYISTNDYISLNQTMMLDYGVYNSDGTANDYISIPMENLSCILSIFFKDDTMNFHHDFSSFKYFKNYTLTNQYTTSSNNPIDLIKGISFIRSSVVYMNTQNLIETVDPETGETVTTAPDNYLMRITNVPVVKSNWIKLSSNFNLLINKIYTTHDALFDAYFKLENQYGIAMIFFNTYGLSKRYRIGNAKEMTDLTRVNCSISIGVELSTMTVSSIFIEKYRVYIKNAIESLNNLDESGKSLYILDLLAESKKSFPEILHVEYYGFNDYDHGAQIIVPKSKPSTTNDIQTYIPEFINIYSYNVNGQLVPKIDIKLLNDTALA